MVRTCLGWLLVTALVGSSSVLKAEDATSLLARMLDAGTQNSLDAPGLRPWHLKVNFQLFDDRQKPTEQGTMEEWWSGPEVYKISYTSPSYTETVVKNKDQYSWSGDSGRRPYMLDALHTMVVHPLPVEKEIEQSTAKLEQRTLGGVKLDCIELKPDNKKHPNMMPPEILPTYCFDRDASTLRLYTFVGYLEVVRNRLGTFQQRNVALDMIVSDLGPSIMTAHITALSTFEPGPTDFAALPHAPTPATAKPINVIHDVPPAIIAGRKLGGPPPHYPEGARERHIQGSVVMTALIGTDGHIHNLNVVASPDRDLSTAAREAVEHWVYQPYLLNGAPVDVETTITVNFRIG